MTATPANCCIRFAVEATCFLPRRGSQVLDSVRLRLTLWYVGVLSAILIAFSVAIYSFAERRLYERVDTDLYSTLTAISAALKHQGGNGEIAGPAAAKVVQELQRPAQAIAIFDAHRHLLPHPTPPHPPPP